MGQLEQNFKTASLELVQIRNGKQEIDREHDDAVQMHQQADQELQVLSQGLARVQESKESKLNNVRAVAGEGFDESPENLTVLYEVEA